MEANLTLIVLVAAALGLFFCAALRVLLWGIEPEIDQEVSSPQKYHSPWKAAAFNSLYSDRDRQNERDDLVDCHGFVPPW